ncbi:aminotransferase [Streptomyces sp. NPDC091281]|uniref:aminotransferase n=1 Tax=Streptomyces sp. NPDC091281 TaxID=3365985 RepID=UPI00381C5B8B
MNDGHRASVRPDVSETDAETLARDLYGIEAVARELGSNQDRNFLLREPDGTRSVLRIDNPALGDEARDAQHAALAAYRAAGVPAPAVLAGPDGQLTQYGRDGLAVRRSEFADGEPMLGAGWLAPVVLREFGALAAASVHALAPLTHPGLDRAHMWVMANAHHEVGRLAPAIRDRALRRRVLAAADEARSAFDTVAHRLPVQAIHGDLTDDNVMGVRGEDGRLHPRVVLDLGDLAHGWRVSELAVTVSSLLHHEPGRPLRVLEAAEEFHARAPLSDAETRALWPLVVLRAAVLVAGGWRQVEIDGDHTYARDRIAVERAIFEAATSLPLAEAVAHTTALLHGAEPPAAPERPDATATGTGEEPAGRPPVRSLLPDLAGQVTVADVGVESPAWDAGRWLDADAEDGLVADALTAGAAVVVLPHGVYRLPRTRINSPDAAATWPIGTELHVAAGPPLVVTTPVDATVTAVGEHGVRLRLPDGRYLVLDGFSATAEPHGVLAAGARLGVLPAAAESRPLSVTLLRADAVEGAAPPLDAVAPAAGRSALVTPERVRAWSVLTDDPADLLGLPARAERDESADERRRRERVFSDVQERYYENPMQIERGWRHHLVDTTGRAYVDLVNNVTGLGHGHPGIADAVDRQIRLLTTNSRFLYRSLAEYSERLLALLPPGSPLDTVLLVNSGSEAVDLALRLAHAATGRRTVVALREAYHGWTMAGDAVTTSAYDNPYALGTRPDWVHVADVPNRFRGTHRGAADDRSVGARYAADLGADLDRLAREGRPAAAFLCESVLGNAGGVLLPEGYLADVYARVRAAGGLCVADEVQVGFGRTGSGFWGFERSGVVPDLIAVAKPMGNGFPVGGVITSRAVADALASQGQFFSSTGGNPLSCRVGIAVLDAMAAEGTQRNARDVGRRLADGFRALAAKHRIIGPVHGEGLYLGVELVRDRDTLEPAAREAAAICERMRELGVIVLTTSERSNVLKVKPPLCITAESADFVVATLDRVLTEGW